MTILEQIQQNIQKRNETFEAMTMMERRVAVAKDVLAMVAEELIEPVKGTYVAHMYVTPEKKGCELQPYVLAELGKSKTYKCSCCAKGAFFLAKIAGYNNVAASTGLNAMYPTEPLGTRAEAGSGIEDVFDRFTWDSIERYFEGWHCDNDGWEEETERDEFLKTPHSERLIAICNNIIENKGEFTLLN